MPRNTTEQQLQLPSFAEVVQAGDYDGVSDEDRITLSRLISLAGEGVVFNPEPSVDDLRNAAIPAIEKGLYIPYSDSRYRHAQQVVRLGVNSQALTAKHSMGVVFPSYEFATVARNAKDLASHTEAKTRRANIDNPDRDEVRRKVGRAVGHTLSGKISSIKTLSADIEADKKIMGSLYRDLKSSWRSHSKAKNLELKRVFADDKIHETAEISSINLNLDSTAVTGMHRAIKKNLYGGNRTHSEIAFNWQEYITMAGLYMGARIHKLGLSEAMCRKEFQRYKYFLEPDARAA